MSSKFSSISYALGLLNRSSAGYNLLGLVSRPGWGIRQKKFRLWRPYRCMIHHGKSVKQACVAAWSSVSQCCTILTASFSGWKCSTAVHLGVEPFMECLLLDWLRYNCMRTIDGPRSSFVEGTSTVSFGTPNMLFVTHSPERATCLTKDDKAAAIVHMKHDARR